MESFEGLCGTTAPRRSLLRSDWGSEEERYGRGLAPFQQRLAEAYHEPSDFPYGFASEEQSEKKDGKIAGVHPVTVESSIVCPPVGGSDKTLEPTQPEMKMASPAERDPFDDFSSQPTPAPLQPAEDPFESPTQPAPKAEQPKAEQPDDDPFFETKTQTPAAVSTESKVRTEVPSQPPSEPKDVERKQREEPKNAAAGAEPSKQSSGLFDDFDHAQFDNVRKVADRIMAGLPSVDLPRILASLPQYVVRMEFDTYRENPDIVGEKLVKVRAMRDGLFSLTSQLTPVYYSAKAAAEYLSQAALVCSNASSREKRLAQIKLADSEFWVRYAEICRTYESVQQTFDFMNQQYEAISRMITILQIRLRVNEISRGELPFDPTPQRIPQHNDNVRPATALGDAPKKAEPVRETTQKAEISSEAFVPPTSNPPRKASGGEVEW